MTTFEPVNASNLDGYGAPEIPWDKVRAHIEQEITQAPETGGPNRHTFWLATINPDGSPHVMPLGALYMEGRFYFTSGPGARKARNLAADTRSTLNVATHNFDLVFEGKAVKLTDPDTAEKVAAIYRAQGWEATVIEGTASLTAPYSAPSAGPPPWDIYEFTTETAYALGAADPYGATRFRF